VAKFIGPKTARQAHAVVIEWDELAYQDFLRNPTGPLGYELMDRLAEVVLAGAKARALRRTGNMIDAMTYELGSDEFGMYADIISPVQDPKTGFPYAMVHEGKRVRDRRPHRSLRPALADVRNILTAG
jgi:hypothetical protein